MPAAATTSKPSVNLDNRIVAVAARLGRFAAHTDLPPTSCPYSGDDDDTSALRRVWLAAYLRVRPPAARSVSYSPDVPVKESARRGTPVTLVEQGTFGTLHPDDVADAEPLGDDEMVLLAVLAELDGTALAEVFDPSQARYPKGHPMGGRFRPMADRIKDSIAAHRRGEHGDKHPLDGYSREQLRRVAKARGIELKRGEDRDSIAAKLLGHFGPGDPAGKPAGKEHPPTPHKTSPVELSETTIERIRTAAAGLPKTAEEWDAVIPRSKSQRDYAQERFDQAAESLARARKLKQDTLDTIEQHMTAQGMTPAQRKRELAKAAGPKSIYADIQRANADIPYFEAQFEAARHDLEHADPTGSMQYPRDPSGQKVAPPELNKHLDQVLDVGRQAYAELRAHMDRDPDIQAARARIKQHDAVHDKRTALMRELNRIEEQPSRDRSDRDRARVADIEAELELLTKQRPASNYNDDHRLAAQREAEIVREALAAARPFGGRTHTAAVGDDEALPDWRARLDTAETYYPTAWLEHSTAQPLTLTSTSRAYYSSRNKTLAMNGHSRPSYAGGYGDEIDEINVHELGHRMEDTVPGLTFLEFAFTRRRSTDDTGRVERPEPLGYGYDAHEVTLPDKWKDRYAGKTYEQWNRDHPAAAPWEVFQVGTQDLFGRSLQQFGDDDLQAFVIGALLTLA